jgi:hypothetical protein
MFPQVSWIPACGEDDGFGGDPVVAHEINSIAMQTVFFRYIVESKHCHEYTGAARPESGRLPLRFTPECKEPAAYRIDESIS